ncbi:hypothetical protein N7520_003253 [Penicillium odoratum]|uniref:uncharacterized protein n=1 Tax=Penicillium odoratum TaxID=1167516 RepID=UPI002549AC9F|nr:uncharacterized protein N7520_003253 [Penicillium odoratum]KAJ5772724.1 hypothetical protein N7520_003253 [Penicillium odoratum]
MRAVGIQGSKGPATSLFIEEVATPSPGEDEVLVQIKAFGLNRMDISQREGRYPVPPHAGPILGVEFSGVIARIGETADSGGWAIGDEVFGLAYGGAYAEYIRVSKDMIIAKPPGWSWELAAAIPETWMTATQAIHRVAHIQPGDKVFWHAGASSVSIAGIQLSIAAGESAVYTTVGTEKKKEFTKTLGAKQSYNYHTEDWCRGIKEATKEAGANIIVDFIGKDYFTSNIEVAAKDGHIVSLGMLSGTELTEQLNIAPILRKRLNISGSTLRGRDLKYQAGLIKEMAEKVIPGIEDGRFNVTIERVFSWKDVIKAHQIMESNTSKGKIVCLVD